MSPSIISNIFVCFGFFFADFLQYYADTWLARATRSSVHHALDEEAVDAYAADPHLQNRLDSALIN
jgi:hypothetical protein